MPPIFADPFPIFLPAMRIITDITRSNPAIVTTSFDNDYISGLIVRIVVPFVAGYWPWGMNQINNHTGTIEVIDSTHFYIDIDTTTYDPFNTPFSGLGSNQRPCVVPVGEINRILTGATVNILNPS
jgi:hypothetical protein